MFKPKNLKTACLAEKREFLEKRSISVNFNLFVFEDAYLIASDCNLISRNLEQI